MKKRILSIIVLMLLLNFTLFIGDQNYIYANEGVHTNTDGERQTENLFEGENYSVVFELVDTWESGYKATVTIKNTGDETIQNWCIAFPLKEKINNLWNAKIGEQYDEYYVVKNAGWNQDILPGKSVSFGFIAENSLKMFPSYYTLLGNKIRVDEGDYTIIYEITEDWGDAYNAQITIQNNRDVIIEDWRLSFDFGQNIITNVWNAIQVSYENNIYLLRGMDHDQNIAAQGQLKIGLTVKQGMYDKSINNIQFYEYSDKSNIKDSDGDGLSDEDEENIFQTDPLKRDTDNNGIDDGDEDFDKDNLTNLQEMEHNTDPFCYDTDDDGLSDSDELYIYFTNPNIPDTDGDGICDGDEVKLGLNPLLKDTDGNGVYDADEFFEQTYTEIIQDNIIDKVCVELKCQGLIDNTVNVENMMNIDMKSSEVVGLIGCPVDISVGVDFDNAILKFYYDDTKLGNVNENDLRIMWYDEENDKYVLLDEETEVDTVNNIVQYETNHFSTYLIVDRTIWLDASRQNISYRDLDQLTFYDVALVVDTSGSMGGQRIKLAKTALNAFVDALMDRDRVALIEFNTYATVKVPLTSSKGEIKNNITQLKAMGGTNAEEGLELAITELINKESDNEKMIILICDGDVSESLKIITCANDNNIVIYCVNVASGTSGVMENLAYTTGGNYYYAARSEDLIKVMENLQKETVDNIDMKDSDGDGIYDIYEINGIKLSNNKIVYTDPNLVDSDGDGISDYDELGGVPTQEVVYVDGNLYSCTIAHMKSHPGKKDSDGDGIPDTIDEKPFSKDIVDIAYLGKYNYLSILDPNGNCLMGGNQGWWKNENKNIEDSGCGLIAMSDLELYLLDTRAYQISDAGILKKNAGAYTNDSYKKFVNKKFETYKVDRVFGVFPKTMEKGLRITLNNNGAEYRVNWAQSYDGDNIKYGIINMLDDNIPVVASYYAPREPLQLYKNNAGALYSVNQKIKSHFFTITGIYKIYEDGKYDTYCRICSWGEEYYIKLVSFEKKISYFSNILSIY